MCRIRGILSSAPRNYDGPQMGLCVIGGPMKGFLLILLLMVMLSEIGQYQGRGREDAHPIVLTLPGLALRG